MEGLRSGARFAGVTVRGGQLGGVALGVNEDVVIENCTITQNSGSGILGLAGAREESLAEIERLLNTPYKINKWRLWLDPRWDFFRDDPRFVELIRPEGAK